MFLLARATLQLVTKACRELYRQYSVNSRMEAVYIRDEMLKLHTKTGSLKRPLEVVRFLEDEISKGDKKLVCFSRPLLERRRPIGHSAASRVSASERVLGTAWKDWQLERDG